VGSKRTGTRNEHLKVSIICLAKSGGIVYVSFMKTPTLSPNCIHSSLGRSALLSVLLLMVCIALLPKAKAVSPAPDGGYPGGNTAEGDLSLGSLTTGLYNTGVGIYSLLSITDGNFCTGVGAGTLLSNTASENTATGAGALFSNTGGESNTANGAFALFSNTFGFGNTAVGDTALLNNGSGPVDIANGGPGSINTAIGDSALSGNTSGSANTAVGAGALGNNTTGNGNIALGIAAGFGIITANNVIAIGNVGGTSTVAGEVDDSCYIDNIFDGAIDFGTALIVGVDQDGKLGTQALPSQGGRQLSLNDLLKEQKKVQNLEAAVAALTEQLKEQAAQIQKVSAQLEASKPAPQVVNNP
jgi:hypothetical protein